MTPEQLRKIDALVATRVMGYHHTPFDRIEPCSGMDDDHECDNCETVRVKHAWIRPCDGAVVYALPPYSSSIEAAWSVVEKMKADKWRVSIEDFDNRYRVNFSRGVRYMSENNREHLSVPLALCLAALAALGVDEKGWK